MRHILSTWHLTLAAILAAGMTLCGCDKSFLFDDADDCPPPVYKVYITYTMNMLASDALENEVTTVTLHVTDEDHNIVLTRTLDFAELEYDGKRYYTTITSDELAPGTYNLLVWAEGYDELKNSWSIPSSSLATDLTCTLNWTTEPVEGWNFMNKDLDRLYHGYVTEQVFPDTHTTVPFEYTVDLTKDTNMFRISLQHVLGGEIDTDRFSFYITDDNGMLDWDNSVIPDHEILYYPWHTEKAVAEGEVDVNSVPSNSAAYTRADAETFNAAIAEFTTGRLMADNNPRLTVVNTVKDKTVFSIPLLNYLLMMRMSAYSDWSDQEFLDREDEWSMTFFLDDNNDWMDSYIYINSWQMVLQPDAAL